MPVYPDGTFVKEAQWNRLIGSIPSSYTIFKDDSTYYGECNLPSGTDLTPGTDAATVIQSALDAITIGQKVFLKDAAYSISTKLIIDTTRTFFVGESRNTILSAANGLNDNVLEVSKASGTAMEVTIANLRILGNKGNQTSGHGIYLNNVNRNTIQNVLIESCKNSGICIEATGGSAGGANRIINVESRANDERGLYLKGTGVSDNLVALSEFRTNTLHGVEAASDSHIFIASRFDENTGNGFYLVGSGYNIINSCIIDRNNANAIRISNTGQYNTIGSSILFLNDMHGILVDADHTNINNCQIWNNDQDDVGYDGVRLEADYNRVTSCTIGDNQGSATQTYGVKEAAGTNYNLIANNTFVTNQTGAVLRVGANTKTPNNIGYITENSGSGTITNPATSEIIAHGLDVTPAAEDITITLKENPTNAITALWVDTIGAANFTVNVEPAPGASDLDFGWKVIVL